jgi:hypothetical protein
LKLAPFFLCLVEILIQDDNHQVFIEKRLLIVVIVLLTESRDERISKAMLKEKENKFEVEIRCQIERRTNFEVSEVIE